MKRALQLLIVLACAVSLACACGLAWVFVPYSIGEAFNSSGLIRTPENFAAERFLHVWSLYLLVALAATRLVAHHLSPELSAEEKSSEAKMVIPLLLDPLTPQPLG